MEPRDFVVKAANGISGNTRLLAFLCPDTPPAALAKAQRSNDWRERAAIAINPNTPEIVLVRLSKEGNAVVRSLAKDALLKRHANV